MSPTTAHEKKRVVLAGAFDTKHGEYGYVRDRLAGHGISTLLLDTGVMGAVGVTADIDRDRVAAAAGTTIERLRQDGDRGRAVTVMAEGGSREIARLHEEGIVAGLIVLGGSNAGYVMSRLAPMLPFGMPKILVSTIVAGDTRPYVGTSDLTMMYPVVDIAGLNTLSISVLARAADACAGMLTGPPVETASPAGFIATSMFGVTTGCLDAVHDTMQHAGWEVHAFHATGVGGRSMEAMLRDGLFDAVADITTTELADELLGGVCSAGPDRLTAAGAQGVPQVVSVGALDMANFGARDTVPTRYAGRLLHAHNPVVTLMRTSPEECAILGRVIAHRVNAARGLSEVVIPLQGFSQISAPGGVFHDPVADMALIDAVRTELRKDIPLQLIDTEINHPAFAEQVTNALSRLLRQTKGTQL